MIKINIDEIILLKERLREINSYDLNEIEFIDEKGNILSIDKKIISQFKLSGLNNTDFIWTGHYKRGFRNIKN